MIDFIKAWVLNIVVLTIFIVLLEMLIPSGKIRKFVNLISGFILIIALINPVLSFIGKEFDFHEFEIPSSNFLDKEDIEEKSKLLDEKQMREISEVYRQKLIRQMEESSGKFAGEGSVKADVIINEDYNSEYFGEIKRVYLYVSESKGEGDIKPVVKVDKVKIPGNNSLDNNSGDVDNSEVDQELRKSLEDEISRVFQVGRENIVVSSVP